MTELSSTNIDHYDTTTEFIEEDKYTARIGNDRLTGHIVLTKYEKTRILGSRQKQLLLGSKPMIKVNEDESYKIIAEKELEVKMTPMIIRRYLPDQTYEDWKISELNQ
tara:strand:- start:1965 stop:2288 length:324 start_codon:yes stop_codon:yes gene_type:complete